MVEAQGPKGRVVTKGKEKEKRAQARQCPQSCAESGIRFLLVIPFAMALTAKVGTQRRASNQGNGAAKACTCVQSPVAKVSTVCSSMQRSGK